VLSILAVSGVKAAFATTSSGDAARRATLPRLRRLFQRVHQTTMQRRKGITMTTVFPMQRRTMLTLLLGGAASMIVRPVHAADASKQVTLYKDPECSCCEGYADYLQSNGFSVKLVPTHDLPLLDEKYGIATDLSPCHISLLGGYVVGGHVPIEVVNRLLAEKPAITGITLPGMPMGSPGMTGRKTEPFKIYEIGKGSPKLYATV
jgi:hypothetical protein